MGELLRCPFCGCDAEKRRSGNDKRRLVRIVCVGYGCSAAIRVETIQHSHDWCEQKAVKLWNTRARLTLDRSGTGE